MHLERLCEFTYRKVPISITLLLCSTDSSNRTRLLLFLAESVFFMADFFRLSSIFGDISSRTKSLSTLKFDTGRNISTTYKPSISIIYTFLLNQNVHKSSYGLCFWALDRLSCLDPFIDSLLNKSIN